MSPMSNDEKPVKKKLSAKNVDETLLNAVVHVHDNGDKFDSKGSM